MPAFADEGDTTDGREDAGATMVLHEAYKNPRPA
jgi:hypothetical protein